MSARVVYLGQKWLGDRCFSMLGQSSLEVRGVVTNTAPVAWWGTAGVHERARETGIPILSNDERRDEELARLILGSGADTLISVQHPWILPSSLLDLVAGRAYNLHSARIPAYRGHNACNQAILAGDREYTVTVHRMDPEPDAGALLFEETFPMPPGVHARALYELALAAGERAFAHLVDALVTDTVPSGRPVPPGGQFFPRSSLDGLRDVTDVDDPLELDRRVRALFFPPFEPAYRRIGDTRLHLLPAGHEAYASESTT